MNARFSRRALLGGLGGVGASLGLLPLLDVEAAPAVGPNGYPRRLIAITWTNGIIPASFYPSASGALGTLPAILSPLDKFKSKILSLRTNNGQNSPFDLKVMFDVNQTYNGHNSYPALLTGTWQFQAGSDVLGSATAPSIDQLIANDLMTKGVTSPLLTLGCRPYSSSTSWRAANQKNTAETDPYRLFKKLFPTGMAPISGGGSSTTTGGASSGAGGGASTGGSTGVNPANALKLRRKSVIDFALSELNSYSSRVGTDDRMKIQAHLDALRALENDLQIAAPGTGGMTSTGGSMSTATGGAATGTGTPLGQGCVVPTLPNPAPNFQNVSSYPQHVDLMLKLAGVAVKCDLARCITIDLIDDGGGNSLTFPWLNINSPDYHLIAHAGSSSYAQKSPIDSWFMERIAGLIADLDSVPEGNGTVLDNTVIVLMNDMNEGANHWVGSVPYLLVGSCGGFFKTGRAVGFSKQLPNNHLLTTLCHAMGLQVSSVGDAKYPGDIDSALTT
jgi:hypothetical protein